MSQIAILVGFCRPLPNVMTFVLPVYRDDSGRFVAQQIDDDGLVKALRPVDISRGFEAAEPQRIGVAVGRPALHGFQLASDHVVVGHALALAGRLKSFDWDQVCPPEDLEDGKPAVVNDYLFEVEGTRRAHRDADAGRWLINLTRTSDIAAFRISEIEIRESAVDPAQMSTPRTSDAWIEIWKTSADEFDRRISEAVDGVPEA